jgi:hypothetical protein
MQVKYSLSGFCEFASKYVRFLDFHLFRHYNNILVALHPLFGAAEDNGTRDNAAGAVARMITTKPHALPLNQVDTMFPHYIDLYNQFNLQPFLYSVC